MMEGTRQKQKKMAKVQNHRKSDTSKAELPPSIAMTVSLSLIHISEPTRQEAISYAVFCLKKKICPLILSNFDHVKANIICEFQFGSRIKGIQYPISNIYFLNFIHLRSKQPITIISKLPNRDAANSVHFSFRKRIALTENINREISNFILIFPLRLKVFLIFVKEMKLNLNDGSTQKLHNRTTNASSNPFDRTPNKPKAQYFLPIELKNMRVRGQLAKADQYTQTFYKD